MKRIRIGLVGDFDEKMYTLVAINEASQHCSDHLPFSVETKWIPTEDIDEKSFSKIILTDSGLFQVRRTKMIEVSMKLFVTLAKVIFR